MEVVVEVNGEVEICVFLRKIKGEHKTTSQGL